MNPASGIPDATLFVRELCEALGYLLGAAQTEGEFRRQALHRMRVCASLAEIYRINTMRETVRQVRSALNVSYGDNQHASLVWLSERNSATC